MSGLTWRKARGCAANGTCVETAAWRKACGASGTCIEACCASGGLALIRDSVDPNGPRLVLTRDRFHGLLAVIKALP